jgi:uncharacterized protein
MNSAGILMEEEQEGSKSEEQLEDTPAAGESSFAEYSIDELNQMLQGAIENEEYEKASRIRDELNKRK